MAFTTPEESFKPTVMFFGLMNSPATFQTMMNKILQNLIDTGKVASFIDNVIISTETKEEHDKLVEEVVKRLVENDLYVKQEKCKWKVREVEFLGVVIGLEEIKIEEDKVEGVLDWPTPKCYKLRTLELVKRKNLILGLTQENSIENSVQDCLPYILKPHGPCYIASSLP